MPLNFLSSVDVSLYESVFNVMESRLPEYDAFGAVRGAAGSALPGIAPSNAYRCADAAYVMMAGNGDSMFRRLMRAIGRGDLESDPGLAQNEGRVARVADIASDPQYLARGMIVQTDDADGRALKVPGIVPKLGARPGRLRTPAPRLGEQNASVLGRAGWPDRAANDDRSPGPPDLP